MTTTFDAIGRVGFGDATYSKVNVTCFGPQSGGFPFAGATLTIPAGTVLAVVGSGAQFRNLVDLVSAPATGFSYLSVSGEFVATAAGPVLAPAGDVTTIITPVAGLVSVSNAAGQSFIGAWYSDEGDGSPDLTADADPIEDTPYPNGAMAMMPSSVLTPLSHDTIGLVLFWDGAAYSLDGNEHPAPDDTDGVADDRPMLVAKMIPLSSNSPASSVAPVVTVLTSPGAAPSDPIHLTVTDADNALRAVVLQVELPNGGYDVVYDGTRFAHDYSASILADIADGLDFLVVRRNGWPDGEVKWNVIAIDTAGNEAS